MKDLANSDDACAMEKTEKFRNMQESLAKNDKDAFKRISEFERRLLELFKDKFELLVKINSYKWSDCEVIG